MLKKGEEKNLIKNTERFSTPKIYNLHWIKMRTQGEGLGDQLNHSFVSNSNSYT